MYNNRVELSGENILRYSRNILVREIGPEGQERLFGAAALVVGAGGLGAPALMYLAAAGVGRIGVIDGDRVDLSNLNRQVIHAERSVGRPKVESAAEALRALRPGFAVEEHACALTAGNAAELFRRYDVVLDGSDNFPTKYLCSDASVVTGVPLVHAGVLRFGGQIMTILPGTGPCLRCMLPEIPPRRDAPTCQEAGIVGAAAGILGSWQAVEAIKILAGVDRTLAGRLLTVDALSGTSSTLSVPRDPDCPACGRSPRIGLPLSDSEYGIERSCPT